MFSKYAFYIWSSYSVVIFVIITNIFFILWQRKKNILFLKRKFNFDENKD